MKSIFDQKSESMQLFFTTHSKVFINEYNMRNVFLLDSNHYEQFSTRKKKNISVIETFLVDTNNDEGYDKICLHLGIEPVNFELLQPNNLLVEGNCDKKYLTELFNYFDLPCPNIESLNGANNAAKYLDFYNSYYHNNTTRYKPKIKLLLDNDSKGRDVYRRITANTYPYIDVSVMLLQNHMNTGNTAFEHNTTNNEIEDFVYPEVIVLLINTILEKKNMEKIRPKVVYRKIHTPAFSAKGIMELCEFEKNSVNPDTGAQISFVSSGEQTCQLKEGLAGLFNLKANKKLLTLVGECAKKYPYVKEALSTISSFE